MWLWIGFRVGNFQWKRSQLSTT